MLLSIEALRVPTDSVFAVTLITASPPIDAAIVVENTTEKASPPVVMFAAVTLTVAFPPMVPPTMLSIPASRAPPVEMLVAAHVDRGIRADRS